MASWRISARAADFERLRDDEAFAEILTLGRVSNFLHAALTPIVQASSLIRDAHATQFAGILFLSRLLSEALQVLERSGKHFRELAAFKELVQPILRDADVTKLRKEWLSPIRNRSVFHNDPEVSKTGLVALKKPTVPQDIVVGDDGTTSTQHYPMSNVVAAMFAYELAGSDDPIGFLSPSFGGVPALAIRVAAAIDALVPQALVERGFAVEPVSRDAG
jgi:hypothetical protein